MKLYYHYYYCAVFNAQCVGHKDDESQEQCSIDARHQFFSIIVLLMHGTPYLQQSSLAPVRLFLKEINTKNCSLSIVLTATDQKPQKSLKR